MKRMIQVLLLCLIYVFISCDSESNSMNIKVKELISSPSDSLAVASMQNLRATRSFVENSCLTFLDDADYIPLLFSTNNGKLVSLSVENAISFDHYILCAVSGLLFFPDNITELNISEYIEGTKINCGYDYSYFYSTLLIDFITGQVIDLSKIGGLYELDTLCFDDNNIYFSINDRVLKINKDNLNLGEYITSDIESNCAKFVVGDYILTTEHLYTDLSEVYEVSSAFLIDNSAVPIRFSEKSLENILIPSNSNEYVYIISSGFGGARLVKISVSKDSFGRVLSQSDSFDINFDYLRVFDCEIPDGLETYNQTVISPNYYNDYLPLYAKSAFDLLGNVWANVLENSVYYFVEDSSELGCHIVEKDVNLKPLSEMKIELYKDGPSLYFVTNNNHVAHINILSGEYEESSYTINPANYEREHISVSSSRIIYKELVTGSKYVTKVANLKNLEEHPVVVDYETSDIVYLPNFSL